MGPNVQSAATDEQLAARFLASPESHREAFAELCARLLHAQIRRMVCVKGLCPGSASRETFAEDVFSLALCRLAQALNQLKSAEGLHKWLMAIAHSAVVDEILDRVRRIRSGPIQFDSLDDLVVRAAGEPKVARILNEVENAAVQFHSCHWRDPETAAIENERLDILRSVRTQHSAASDKGAECGVIVALIYAQEMTIRQIAGVLGRKKSTVHDIVHDNMTTYREMYTRIIDGKPAHCKGSAL